MSQLTTSAAIKHLSCSEFMHASQATVSSLRAKISVSSKP